MVPERQCQWHSVAYSVVSSCRRCGTKFPFLIYISFWKVLADRSRGSHLTTLLKVLSLVLHFLAFIFPPLKKTGNLIHSSWTFHKVRRFCQEVRIKRFQFWTKSSSQQHEEPWCKELFTKELFKGTALSNAAFANASYISISPDWYWSSRLELLPFLASWKHQGSWVVYSLFSPLCSLLPL